VPETLYINGSKVALAKGMKGIVSFDISIDDYRNPSARRGHRSNSVTIPKTKANEDVLGYTDPTVTGQDFDDKALNEYYITDHAGVTTSKGIADVVEGGDSYKVRLYSNNAKWSLRGDIRDLDMGEKYFDESEAVATFDKTGWDVRYTMIDYGVFEDLKGGKLGDAIRINELFPAISVKQILDRAFEEIDHTIKYEGICKKWIDRLEIPYTGKGIQITQRDKDDNVAIAERAMQLFRATWTGHMWLKIPIPVETFDPGNNYFVPQAPPNIPQYSCPFDGDYDIHIEFDLEVINVGMGNLGAPPLLGEWEYTFQLWHSVWTPTQIAAEKKLKPNNGIPLLQWQTTKEHVDILFTDVPAIVLQTFWFMFYIENTPEHGTASKIGPATVIRNLKCTYTPKNIPLGEGASFDIAKTLPKMKQKTLFRSVTQLLNLMIDTPDDSTEITCMTYDDFYLSETNADDWEDKVDTSKPVKFSKLKELKKELEFSWLDDDDLLLTEADKKDYADRTYELRDEFLEGSVDVVKMPFAATKMGNSFDNTIYMPLMYKDEDEISTERKPRLLLNGGKVLGGWRSTRHGYEAYPLSYFIPATRGDFDMSLAMGNHDNLKGIVDKLHLDKISKWDNSKMMLCHVRLNSKDMLNLNFRNPKKLRMPNGNTAYFFLNKIKGYLPGVDGSYPCELIQVPNG
jgi:hypothetical protein